MIVEAVDQHREGVIALEIVVAAQLRRADLGRRRIDELGADVEVRPVVEHADARLFGGRLPFERLLLPEPAEDRRPLPEPLVEPAVDRRPLLDEPGLARRRPVLPGPRRGPAGQYSDDDKKDAGDGAIHEVGDATGGYTTIPPT